MVLDLEQKTVSPSATNIIFKDLKVSAGDLVGNKKGRILEEYDFMQKLGVGILILPTNVYGVGAYGLVKKVRNKKTGQIRACKIIKKQYLTDEELERLSAEVGVLKALVQIHRFLEIIFKDHPNIMKIIETYDDKKHFFVVMEYYDGGELFEKIVNSEDFGEREAARIMKQILSAVSYCHENNIVHR